MTNVDSKLGCHTQAMHFCLSRWVLVIFLYVGCGGGHVVSVLAFCSDDPSLNSADVYRFFLLNLCLKRPEIN